jgi:hypothetical protein
VRSAENTSSSLVEVHQCVGRTYCLLLQVLKVNQASSPKKRGRTPDAASQKRARFIITDTSVPHAAQKGLQGKTFSKGDGR